MTPAHTDSPLRRSDAGIFRDGAPNHQPHHNDDEEERREARRWTLVSSGSATDTSMLEESENLKKCLEIYHDNKISRDNAWSLSLIDTVSNLLDRHHKSLNNFSVAGSSLEASSKVYGLRVDSVHSDVLRMSAGMNARKFRKNAQEEDDDGVATGGEGGADPNSSAGTGIDAAETAGKKKKRQRKNIATVTKNIDTLNTRLDTVPLQDPVFGKLNLIVGSINASNRLMNNMLHTMDAELRLRMTHRFWDGSTIEENCDYTAPVPHQITPGMVLFPCERLSKLERFENRLLRPANSGYVISDTPEPSDDDKAPTMSLVCDDMSNFIGDNHDMNENYVGCDVGRDASMAFDINAECEPLPNLNSYAPIIAMDEADFADFTAAEHTAIGKCRGLRKAAVVIEDMRPVDSTTTLEYSYRPVEKISQFWAGPSHWRFRRTRHRTMIGQSGNSKHIEAVGRTLNRKNRRANASQLQKRLKVEFTTPIHDSLFIKLDSKFKSRKANIQKKSDQRKLRLPTDLRLKASTLVRCHFYAPAFGINRIDEQICEDDDYVESSQPLPMDVQHFNSNENDDDRLAGNDLFAVHGAIGENDMPALNTDEAGNAFTNETQNSPDDNNPANDTVLEIATDFKDAPRQVTKIVVPFAKRAKVIDMKTLKRCCMQIISQQLKDCTMTESHMPIHPTQQSEHYSLGWASFQEVYKHLPSLLTPTMAESLTTSIALYSVLHLANDFSYRLIPQENLADFKIRQVIDD